MTLTLEITAATGVNTGDAPRHVFGEDGGSIGRAAHNAWVLTHKQVSGQHAQISFRNGVFYIQDTSRNGVSVNSPDNRLVRNRPYALKTGDRIFIEPYEIDVWIDAASDRPAARSRVDPFADDDPFAPRQAPPVPLPTLGPLPESAINDEVDPLKFFDPLEGRNAARKSEPVAQPGDELLDAHYQPPIVLPSSPPPAPVEPVTIPQGYDPLRPDEPFAQPPMPAPIRSRPSDAPDVRPKATEPSATDSTVRQPAPPLPPPSLPRAADPVPSVPRPEPVPRESRNTGDLAELLAGAGVPDAAITPQLSRSLGQILRIVVSGLMDVLQSRQRIKEEFRMQQTIFRPNDNNPLKFSVNVEDALHNLLVKRNVAYLGPVDAFADAFDDLRDHQLAMLAGMRVAFEAMLAEFDPDKLQEEFDAQLGKLSLPLVPAKLRYWELFRDRQTQMSKDAEATFDRLFGEEFRRAYEEQFRKLKAKRRTRTRPESPET